MTYDEYIQEWDGRQVTKYGGECVAGIAEFESENGLPIVWGDAHTWINNPAMLGAYDWVTNNPNDPNQIPPRGAIVVWPLPNEHIAFFDRPINHLYFESFGQNSGGPTMHFQQSHWLHVAGWYVLKQAAPAPPPTPAPPAPSVNPYTIEAITPKEVRLNKNTHRWGLNYDNFTAINNNPEGDIAAGAIITVTGILHHNIGYQYYLENSTVASGFNTADCDDYTPPPPPSAPEPPAPVVTRPPDGPLRAPSTQTYEVVVDVRGFQSSNQAVNHINDKVTVPIGTYFIFNVREPAINVTKTPGVPGAWINGNDNVIAPPAPEPAPAEPEAPSVPDFAYTYRAFDKPQLYVAMRDLDVTDLAGEHKTAKMKKFDITWISGSFEKDGIDYALPLSAAEKDWWYGIEWVDKDTNTSNIELEKEVFRTKTTLAERKATNSLNKLDYLRLAIAHIKNFYLAFTQFMSKIKPGKPKINKEK